MRKFKVCDFPTAEQLNELITLINQIHAITPIGEENYPRMLALSSGQEWRIFHSKRYLIYGSEGDIIDPAGVADPIGASEPEDTEYGCLDLEKDVDWLVYGMYYIAKGFTFCFEDDEPL